MVKNVAILGATGSIGSHAIAVIEKHPDQFAIWGLSSHTRTESCCAMVKKFRPKMVAVSSEMIRREWDPYKFFVRELVVPHHGFVLVFLRGVAEMALSHPSFPFSPLSS